MKFLKQVLAVVLLNTIAFGQGQAPPTGYVAPIAMAGMGPNGLFVETSINGSGGLVTTPSTGTFFQLGGFIGSTAPVAQDSAGNWHYLQVDGTGALKVSASGGVTSSGTSPNLAAFTSASNIGNATAHNVAAPELCIAASASGSAYTCTTAPTFTPANGDTVYFKADVASTGSATLAVNGASAATIKKQSGAANLIANDLTAGMWALMTWDSTNSVWQMQTPPAVPVGVGGLTAGQVASAIKCNDTSVSANAITCTPTNALTSYVDGTLYLVKVANTNTGATTIAISGLASKNVTEGGGNAATLNGGELLAGTPYIMQYDGTQFQILDTSVIDCAAAPGATLDAKIANSVAASTSQKAVVIDCRNVAGTPNMAGEPLASLLDSGYTASTGGYILMPLQQVNWNSPVTLPSGWQMLGNAAQFASGSNGTYLKAGAGLLPKYTTGTINSTSCTAGPPITCTITGNSGTNWVTSAGVKAGMHFTLCATNGGNSSAGLCPTSAANAVDGRIRPGFTDTSITITSVVNSTSNGAGTYNYVIYSPMLEMGDESASSTNPGNFGVQLGGLKVDPNGVSGAIPVYVRSCQNLCGFNGPVYVNPSDSIGLALMGNQMQNSGPWFPFWSVCQAGKCASTTIGILVRGNTSVPTGVNDWSSAADAVAGATPIAIDSPMWMYDSHVLASGAADGVAWGTAIGCLICDLPALNISGGGVVNLNAAAGGTGTALHIGTNLSPSNYVAMGIKVPVSSGFTNTFKDDNRPNGGCTLANATSQQVGLYAVGDTIASYISTINAKGCDGIGSVGALTIAGLTGASGAAAENLLTLTGGTGGPAATVTSAGNQGGLASITTGNGSSGGATSGTGGAGGDLTIITGNGGASAVGSTTGRGGNISITLGIAGGTGTQGLPGGVTITQGADTATTSSAILALNGTWNNASIAGPAFSVSVMNTSSSATAVLVQYQAGAGGGTTEWQVDKGGTSQQQGSIRTINTGLIGFNSAGLNSAVATNINEVASGVLGIGTTAANTAALYLAGNTCHITADVNLTVNTANSFCSWSLPASAQAWSFECTVIWAITAGSGTNTFALGVNPSQTPTGTTNAIAVITTATSGTQTNGAAAISTSGATSVLTGATYTPAATLLPATISGTLLGSGTAGTFAVTATANGTTATAAVKAGSQCVIR